jgi:hypothetical protein
VADVPEEMSDDELRDARIAAAAQTDQLVAAALSRESAEALARAGEALQDAMGALVRAGVEPSDAAGTIAAMAASGLVGLAMRWSDEPDTPAAGG